MAGDGSDEERGSGEYYSGEDFQEDEIMLAGDRRYCITMTASDHLLCIMYEMYVCITYYVLSFLLVSCFLFLTRFLFVVGSFRRSYREYHDTVSHLDPETTRGYHHPESFFDDDEQPIYQECRRSPIRRLLSSSPQSKTTQHVKPDMTRICRNRNNLNKEYYYGTEQNDFGM